MPKYEVYVTIPVFAAIKVEAEDSEEAIDKAWGYSGLTGYCGNGGTDKLVGTYEQNVSLEPGDSPLEGPYEFKTEVEEIDESE